eukprot:9366595-Pyramimonas_sp.AAC.1
MSESSLFGPEGKRGRKVTRRVMRTGRGWGEWKTGERRQDGDSDGDGGGERGPAQIQEIRAERQ